MDAVSYIFAVALVAICVAAACIAVSAYAVSRRRQLLLLALFVLCYAFEQAVIFYNEYVTQNVPFSVSGFASMEDSLLRLCTGAALCQTLWLAFCTVIDERRSFVQWMPLAGFVAASLFVLLTPGLGDGLRKWAFYSLRQAFLLGMAVYSIVRCKRTESEALRARLKRKKPLIAAFSVLVILTFLEDTVVMLLIDPVSMPFSDFISYLYRRNTCESVLVLVVMGYTVRLALQTLELKGEERPREADDSMRLQAHDILPFFSQRHGLTPREKEILAYVVDGKDNYQIARELQLAVGTVKTHVHNVFKKTGVKSREELIKKFWAEE